MDASTQGDRPARGPSRGPRSDHAPTQERARGAWALETVALRKTYWLSRTNSFEALRGVDLRIAHGERVAVMGPSGSGKSTLLHLLGTLDRATSGRVIINGTDTSDLSGDQLARLRNRELGFVFQQFNLIHRMSALDNVALALIPQGAGAAERRRRAREALELVGLGDRLANRPLELSGGQQQRVAIARALVTGPTILLADEPTGALDSHTSSSIMALLRELNERLGLTLIIVTHDPLVARATDRTVYLLDGLVAPEPSVPGVLA